VLAEGHGRLPGVAAAPAPPLARAESVPLDLARRP
jgi:hypothetical protein